MFDAILRILALTRKELLAASRRFIDQAHALEHPCSTSPGHKKA